jgi:hypothetical protein
MEDWEREQAEQGQEIAALLAGIADSTTDAYEGAFAATGILQNGGRLLRAERLRCHLDKEPVDDLPEECDDPRRLILLRMVGTWEERADLRSDVKREIVEFARTWCTGGEQGVQARHTHRRSYSCSSRRCRSAHCCCEAGARAWPRSGRASELDETRVRCRMPTRRSLFRGEAVASSSAAGPADAAVAGRLAAGWRALGLKPVAVHAEVQ